NCAVRMSCLRLVRVDRVSSAGIHFVAIYREKVPVERRRIQDQPQDPKALLRADGAVSCRRAAAVQFAPARTDNELGRTMMIALTVGVLTMKTFVAVVVAVEYDLGLELAQHAPQVVEILLRSVIPRAEARSMKERQDRLARVCRQVVSQPA